MVWLYRLLEIKSNKNSRLRDCLYDFLESLWFANS